MINKPMDDTAVIDMIAALREFVSCVNVTGGAIRYENGTYGLEGDPDWIDLGSAYLQACEALGVTPIIKAAP